MAMRPIIFSVKGFGTIKDFTILTALIFSL